MAGMQQRVEDPDFIAAWNGLERRERLRIRRLVRIGRDVDDAKLAPIAAGYARYQTSRLWLRYFWLWFVPGVVLALGIASQIHPVLVGAVIALAAQSAFAYFNLRRFGRRHALSAPALN
jgi:hypothetical protein